MRSHNGQAHFPDYLASEKWHAEAEDRLIDAFSDNSIVLVSKQDS